MRLEATGFTIRPEIGDLNSEVIEFMIHPEIGGMNLEANGFTTHPETGWVRNIDPAFDQVSHNCSHVSIFVLRSP